MNKELFLIFTINFSSIVYGELTEFNISINWESFQSIACHSNSNGNIFTILYDYIHFIVLIVQFKIFFSLITDCYLLEKDKKFLISRTKNELFSNLLREKHKIDCVIIIMFNDTKLETLMSKVRDLFIKMYTL